MNNQLVVPAVTANAQKAQRSDQLESCSTYGGGAPGGTVRRYWGRSWSSSWRRAIAESRWNFHLGWGIESSIREKRTDHFPVELG